MHWPSRCRKCYSCLAACPKGALAKDSAGALVIDRAVNYECSDSWDFQIATMRGKPTRKYFHVCIYRLDSGRYELNTYIL
jgi:Fe-S-cluster-containing hydrogenase component 2